MRQVKRFCIAPMANLVDTKTPLRLIVPKPLLLQTCCMWTDMEVKNPFVRNRGNVDYVPI